MKAGQFNWISCELFLCVHVIPSKPLVHVPYIEIGNLGRGRKGEREKKNRQKERKRETERQRDRVRAQSGKEKIKKNEKSRNNNYKKVLSHIRIVYIFCVKTQFQAHYTIAIPKQCDI